MENSGFTEGFAVGQGMANNNCCMPYGGGFGGLGGWGGDWLAIIVLAALFGGGYGFGGFGGGFGGGYGVGVFGEVQRGFDTQGINSNLNGIENGLCDGFYAQNTNTLNGFSGVQNALCQGFAGVNATINQTGNTINQGICNLGYNLSQQLSDCCCQTQRGLDRIVYESQANTCNLGNLIQSTTRDIIENANNNHRDMKDFMVQTEMNNLRAENQNLRFERSQANQNAYFGATVDAAVAELIRRTGHECPTPAYVVQPPQPVTFPTNCYGTANYASYGAQNACSCGC
jgi:hypothetical protein